uniref:Uncharacterized protein n=1 Tax=Megaselia scalaris TaxID=36166 RepID=T1H2J0_MEGSC
MHFNRKILEQSRNTLLKSPLHNLTLRKFSSAYEGDGKTTVTVLNQDIDSGLMVDTYSQYGFRLNNDL